MSPGGRWRRALRTWSVPREVDDEIAFHLAMREERLRRAGLPSERAHAAALARFGDPARVRQECIAIDRGFARERNLAEWLSSLLSDFRVAFRSQRRRPGFTLIAALTLALGIGSTTAMFSLVDGILLRPLPYPHPERLVRLLQAYPEKGLDEWPLSEENVAMYRDRVPQLASFAGYQRAGATYANDGHPERLSIVRATGDFFEVLGVKAAVGRLFGRAEDVPHAGHVAVLSYQYWRTEFAGDPRVVGRVVDLDGQPTTIIGVAPRGFAFPRPDAQVYVPLGLDPTRRFGWFLTGIGRLAPGRTIEQLRRASTSVLWDWARARGDLLQAGVDPRATRITTLVEPLHEAMVGDTRRPLEVLQAAVLLILLIAVANVATLLSSRFAGRMREVALRSALGATRARVVRQLLTESLALAALGGVGGIALTALIVSVVRRSSALSLPPGVEIAIDWRVLAVTLASTLAAGIAFGLAPAISLARGGLAPRLAGGERGSASRVARRTDNLLVGAQVALSLVLLVSAGLVLESFQRLVRTDLGFSPAGVTTIALPLPAKKYADPLPMANAGQQIVDSVRAVPGVRDAAIAWAFPFSGNVNTDGFVVEGHAPPSGSTFETQTVQVAVGPGFFRTLRIPLLSGRDFTVDDRNGTLPVAIVDQALARRYWRGAEALGRHIRLTGDTTWFTIVGIAGAVRDEDVATEPRPHMYFPFAQAPDNRPMLAIRTDGDPARTIAVVRRVIASLEPAVPLDNVRPLESWISHALETRRLTELLLSAFAALAALLAAVGLYGVISLYVANRRHEFGIRLAVGGEPRHLLRLVMTEGLRVAGAGVAVGLVAALLSARWLRALLYEVSPTDPVVYGVIALALLAVAAVSCYLPARRATRSDPLVALRAD